MRKGVLEKIIKDWCEYWGTGCCWFNIKGLDRKQVENRINK